jgi:hypothetical protein
MAKPLSPRGHDRQRLYDGHSHETFEAGCERAGLISTEDMDNFRKNLVTLTWDTLNNAREMS